MRYCNQVFEFPTKPLKTALVTTAYRTFLWFQFCIMDNGISNISRSLARNILLFTNIVLCVSLLSLEHLFVRNFYLLKSCSCTTSSAVTSSVSDDLSQTLCQLTRFSFLKNVFKLFVRFVFLLGSSFIYSFSCCNQWARPSETIISIIF
jgi:hypothetical protein